MQCLEPIPVVRKDQQRYGLELAHPAPLRAVGCALRPRPGCPRATWLQARARLRPPRDTALRSTPETSAATAPRWRRARNAGTARRDSRDRQTQEAGALESDSG